MDQLLITFAKTVPEETLIDLLDKSLKAYQADRTLTHKTDLVLYCTLISIREASKGKTLNETIEYLARIRQLSNVFKNKN